MLVTGRSGGDLDVHVETWEHMERPTNRLGVYDTGRSDRIIPKVNWHMNKNEDIWNIWTTISRTITHLQRSTSVSQSKQKMPKNGTPPGADRPLPTFHKGSWSSVTAVTQRGSLPKWFFLHLRLSALTHTDAVRIWVKEVVFWCDGAFVMYTHVCIYIYIHTPISSYVYIICVDWYIACWMLLVCCGNREILRYPDNLLHSTYDFPCHRW